jgi:hypothetical protein
LTFSWSLYASFLLSHFLLLIRLKAGLFSAVVTTFVAQTSQTLQADYPKISASLLTELVGLQRALIQGSSAESVSASELSFVTPFEAEKTDRWVNGLWFTSLSLSLSTALFSVLVKQWIQNYISALTGDVQGRVHTRQFRYNGLDQWHVRAIIGLLPLMMHMSLCIFFIGLVIFLKPLDGVITWVVCSLSGTSYGLYIVSNTLPMIILNCPFRTPVSEYSFRMYSFVFRQVFQSFTPSSSSTLTLKEMEVETRENIHDELDSSSFIWLTQNSSSPTAMNVALQALSGLEDNEKTSAMFLTLGMTYDSSFSKIWRNEVASFVERAPDDSEDYLRMERFSRAILKLSLTYLNENRNFLSPPMPPEYLIDREPLPIVPSFTLLKDGAHHYIRMLRERGLATKMHHLVICAAGLSCMLGRLFPGISEPLSEPIFEEIPKGRHEIDISMCVTSVAEVLRSNPAQDEKIRQYFTLLLHHLRISLKQLGSKHLVEILPGLPEAKTIVWCLVALREYFTPKSSSINLAHENQPHVSMILAIECLHTILIPESRIYDARLSVTESTHQVIQQEKPIIGQNNMNQFFLQCSVEAVKLFCPRRWPLRDRGIDGRCGLHDDALIVDGVGDNEIYPESTSLDGQASSREASELAKRLHFALADGLRYHDTRSSDLRLVSEQSWQDAVIDLLQTIGPDADSEARVGLISLYERVDIKSSLEGLPSNEEPEALQKALLINRYIMHDMCHTIKSIPAPVNEEEPSLARYSKLSAEVSGIFSCLRKAPEDTRLIEICIEENIMRYLIKSYIPKEQEWRCPLHELVLRILESSKSTYESLSIPSKQCLIGYLLNTDDFLTVIYALQDKISALEKVFMSLYQKFWTDRLDFDSETVEVIELFRGIASENLCVTPSWQLQGFVDKLRDVSKHTLV